MLQLPKNYQPQGQSEQVYRLMEDSYDNLLLSGRAGTGKSTLITYFRQRTEKNLLVLASTGIAALNVQGQTIHSFFAFPFRRMVPNDPDIHPLKKGSPKQKALQQLDTIIIDEVSMVRADLLDALDESLRINLKSPEPFGGLQIILVGDVFQLAPVDRDNEAEPQGLPLTRREYKSPFFFSAEAFKKGDFRLFELEKVYRQSQADFLKALNHIRLAQPDSQTLQMLNERVSQDTPSDKPPVLLTTTNYIAESENRKRLAALRTKEKTFKASKEKTFPPSMIRTDMELKLKEGARVMLLTNDTNNRWRNGSLGTVKGFEENDEGKATVQVQLDEGETVEVTQHEWENVNFRYDNESQSVEKQIVGRLWQYPLKLAWAITIHKSQGLTFDKVRLDLGRGTFASGQLYVALSRCRTLEGLQLLRPIQRNDLIVDPIVWAFYRWMREQLTTQNQEPRHAHPRRPPKPLAKAEGREDAPADKAQQKAERRKKRQEKNRNQGKLANDGLPWLKEEETQLQELFEAGAGFAQLSKELERKPSAIGGRLKKLELVYNFLVREEWFVFFDGDPETLPKGETKEWTQTEIDELLERYQAGENPQQLAQAFRVSLLQLMSMLRRQHVLPQGEDFCFGPLWVECRAPAGEQPEDHPHHPTAS